MLLEKIKSCRAYNLFLVHGLRGILKLCISATYCRLFWFTPSQRRARSMAQLVQDRDLEFDKKWGVQTSGIEAVHQSEIVGDNWCYGFKYQGCSATTIEQLLGELAIKHEEFTFIDFGSGKGRALLVASRFPFNRIIGVEYSERLNDIARRNLTCFPNSEMRCKEIDIVTMDAASFPIPEGPLIIFLYCPFGKQVMAGVIRNVVESFQQAPRRIIVIYFNALFTDMWKGTGIMQEIRSSRFITVFDTQSAEVQN